MDKKSHHWAWTLGRNMRQALPDDISVSWKRMCPFWEPNYRESYRLGWLAA